MKKIVIVTNRPEPDHSLLASLNMLFPECEVQIVFKKSETVAQYPASCSSDRLMAHTGDIGLLINFGAKSLEYKRLICTNKSV